MEDLASTPVVATAHAIKQYRAKMLQFTGEHKSDKEIAEILCNVVRHGKQVRKLPGELVECKYGNLYVTVAWDGTAFVVVTFNGDGAWRHWWRHEEVWHRSKRKLTAAL